MSEKQSEIFSIEKYRNIASPSLEDPLFSLFVKLVDEYIDAIKEVFDIEDPDASLVEAYELFKERHPELDEDSINAIAEEAVDAFFTPLDEDDYDQYDPPQYALSSF